MSDIKIYAFADEASDSFEKQIEAMVKNGLNGIEIRNVDGLSVKDISDYKARELKAKMDANGLEFWSLGSPIGKIVITDKFGPHLDNFRRLLEINNILGAKVMRLFSFYMPEGEQDFTPYRDEVMDRLSRFVDAAKGSGIVLCHENEKGIYGDNAERCLDILKNISEIKGVFDPANFVQCNQDTIKAWEMLKPYIEYLHIKDALADGTVVPAGDGIGNVPTIVKDYVKLGGTRLTVEPHLFDFIGLSNLEREGEKSVVTAKRFADSFAAFDAAIDATKAIIASI